MELGIASAAAITAATYLIGMAVGIASGWAATGVHQSVKQMTNRSSCANTPGCARRRVAACADVCYDRAIEWIW